MNKAVLIINNLYFVIYESTFSILKRIKTGYDKRIAEGDIIFV